MERKPQEEGRNVVVDGLLLYLPNKTGSFWDSLFRYCTIVCLFHAEVKAETAPEGGGQRKIGGVRRVKW